MKFTLALTALFVLLHNSAASAISPRENVMASVVRQDSCPKPEECREIGGPFIRTILRLRNGLNPANFDDGIDQFMDLIKPGGAADFTNGIYRNDCCLRIFGEQVANFVPSLIAYGFIGREVLPGHFLLAFKGYEENNPGVTIRDFINFLGSDFEGDFTRTCLFRRTFPYPCLTGDRLPLRNRLDPFIDNRFDLSRENSERVGTFLGNTVGAYTSNFRMLREQITEEFTTFDFFELPRCCVSDF